MLLVGQQCLTFFATAKKNCVQIKHVVFYCLINYHRANIFLSIFRFLLLTVLALSLIKTLIRNNSLKESVLVTESGSLPVIIRYQEN